MSEEMLKTVKNILASGKGDSKRLQEIIITIRGGEPILLSDYKYIESLTSQTDSNVQESEDESQPITQGIRDESIEILRIRLAKGQIAIDEFRELKKALTGS